MTSRKRNGLLFLSIKYAFTKYLLDENKNMNESINLDQIFKIFIVNENDEVHLISNQYKR